MGILINSRLVGSVVPSGVDRRLFRYMKEPAPAIMVRQSGWRSANISNVQRATWLSNVGLLVSHGLKLVEANFSTELRPATSIAQVRSTMGMKADAIFQDVNMEQVLTRRAGSVLPDRPSEFVRLFDKEVYLGGDDGGVRLYTDAAVRGKGVPLFLKVGDYDAGQGIPYDDTFLLGYFRQP
ncbi:MAG: hypothetical protein WC527_04345 [Candidatus Margulisiibacteriota bacterium]